MNVIYSHWSVDAHKGTNGEDLSIIGCALVEAPCVKHNELSDWDSQLLEFTRSVGSIMCT